MKNKLFRLSFFLFLFSIPFGTKKFLFSITGEVSEFYSVFLYGADILLVAILLLFFFRAPLFRDKTKINVTEKNYSNVLKNIGIGSWGGRGLFFVFLFFAFVSIFLAANIWLAFYHFLRLLLAITAGFLAALFLRKNIASTKDAAIAIGASSVFQSIIGFFQFLRGEGIGLRYLGETVITNTAEGVARVAVGGEHFLRAYGTMPHANILAAFLILGLFSFSYLFLYYARGEEQSRFKIVRIVLVSGGIFITFLGLVLTFSRSGWITAVISFLFFLALLFMNKEWRRIMPSFVFVLIFSFVLIFYALNWAIIPRVHLERDEPSVNYRILYNKIGLDLIRENPFGVGIGNQEFTAINEGFYERVGISRRADQQPVHNIYLLMASEVGILGLISFLIFLYCIVFKNPKSEVPPKESLRDSTGQANSKQITNSNTLSSKPFGIRNLENWNLFRVSNLEFSICLIMLIALLGFGLFDHFLWTLQSGRLMLWLAIGLVLGLGAGNNNNEGASPHSLKDKAQASGA